MTRALADTLVDVLEREIRDDDLQPGHFIGTKRELLDRFNVAPATLGEAIRVLRNRGLISVKPGPGGGIFLAEQSPIMRLGHELIQFQAEDATVDDCVRITDSLDRVVMIDAVEHRTERDVRELKKLFAELDRVWESSELAQPLNWKLHKRIAQISPNRILSTVYTNVVDFILTNLDGLPSVPGFPATSRERLDVHRRLVEAIVDRDSTAALAAVRDHQTVLRTK